MTEFHFIRPLWLLMLAPLLVLAWLLFRKTPSLSSWSKVCDAHLLPYLIQTKGYSRRTFSFFLLIASAMLMIISLAGPTWSRFPVPSYQRVQPRVVVLDMSEAMMINDLRPDRLSRAKFKLHDLFQHQDVGQFGLVVYTGEPFVVSPLTEDSQTIDALLPSLTPLIMPVAGEQLSSALEQAAQLIVEAGFQGGQLLVLTAATPSTDAIKVAKKLASNGVYTSIMPVVSVGALHNSSLFKKFAEAGQGALIPFSDTSKDIDQWLAATRSSQNYVASLQNDIPVWLDEGCWFLIPALLCLLPVFRRGWLA